MQRKRRAIVIEVVQAFDRTPIARLDSDDAAALDRKIEAARRLFADRGAYHTAPSFATRIMGMSVLCGAG